MSGSIGEQFGIVGIMLDLHERYFPTAARVSDPVTSHIASEEHTDSGNRRKHAEDVLLCVQARPGLTYRELATYMAWLEPVEVMRRLNDLHHQEFVYASDQRPCSVSGRKAQTWWPRD